MRTGVVRCAPGGLALTAALLLALLPATASAAVVTATFQARYGTLGVGTVRLFDDAHATVVINLAHLKPGSSYAVTLERGACPAAGSVVARLPTLTVAATGKLGRTIALTPARARPVVAGMAAHRLLLRIGSLCRALYPSTATPPPASPPPASPPPASPTESSSPGPTPTPGPGPTPASCGAGANCIGSAVTFRLPNNGAELTVTLTEASWVTDLEPAPVTLLLSEDPVMSQDDLAPLDPILEPGPALDAQAQHPNPQPEGVLWASGIGLLAFTVPQGFVQAPMWLGLASSTGRVWWLLASP
jgi:hypothetical protein